MEKLKTSVCTVITAFDKYSEWSYSSVIIVTIIILSVIKYNSPASTG